MQRYFGVDVVCFFVDNQGRRRRRLVMIRVLSLATSQKHKGSIATLIVNL